MLSADSINADSESEIIFVQERSEGNQWTKPLLECDVEHSFFELDYIKNSVLSFLIKQKTEKRTGVYFRDLENGHWFGINENNEFEPASLSKVLYSMMIYKLSEKDPQVLEKRIEYQNEFLESRNILKSEPHLISGESYSIKDLVERSLIYSDNESADILRQQILAIDANYMINQQNKFGFKFTTISLKEYSDLFRYLYNSSYINAENSSKILEILSKSSYKNGIVKPLPEDLVVSHKFGNYTPNSNVDKNVFSHCAIVYKPDHPYLLCAYERTNDNNSESIQTAVENISEISKIVYSEFYP